MSGNTTEGQKQEQQHIAAEITEQHHGAAETERAQPHSSPSCSLAESLHNADHYCQADSLQTADVQSQADILHKADDYSQGDSSQNSDDYSQADDHCREKFESLIYMCVKMCKKLNMIKKVQ